MDLNVHGTDDQLELYARGRLPAPDVVVLEEHLLMCEACVERLEETEQWSLAARAVLREEPVAETGWRSWPSFTWSGGGWVRQPGFAMALAVLLLIAGAVGYFSRGGLKLAPVATLQLTAMRGDMETVPPAQEVDLTLTDAPASGEFRVQVVDEVGSQVWDGKVTGTAGGRAVRLQRRLRQGAYFVRLYGLDGQLMHEYGFRVR